MELSDGRRKVPRSYGSMTYALLKGYLFAGFAQGRSARVAAAWGWLTQELHPRRESRFRGFLAIRPPPTKVSSTTSPRWPRHWISTATEVVVDAAGTEHAWRTELTGRLVSLQRQDGSWLNENAPRWYEGNPVLATAYALITLDTALPPRR